MNFKIGEKDYFNVWLSSLKLSRIRGLVLASYGVHKGTKLTWPDAIARLDGHPAIKFFTFTTMITDQEAAILLETLEHILINWVPSTEREWLSDFCILLYVAEDTNQPIYIT